MKGKVLGNRYELLEKIGGGGMAIVYKAKCRLLNRFVAVKILKTEFINDEEFVKRFRIEAQSAASLSHPNIVSVYDVGQEDSVHYIVMEYIDGITLKEYINTVKKVQWKEAVKISIQICSAIEHAHRNHIVHRDIKPHNIMITEEGVAKVTDFGIARAVSSSTITMVGSTIGSVHYFSPEQARGGYVDEKSDLYSLGIALYEMITGKLPFEGDTPVAVAMKHIQDEAPKPIEIEKNVPSGINDIILKAIKKDQNRRYQSAAEMIEDLKRVLEEPNGSFVAENDYDDMPTQRIQTVGTKEFKQSDSNTERIGKEETKKKDKFSVKMAVSISVALIVVFTLVGYYWVTSKDKNDVFKMENYVGKKYEDVKKELEEKDIKVSQKQVESDSSEKGLIISQSIKEGEEVKPGGIEQVVFEVSSGANLVEIPDVTKMDSREAEKMIRELELKPRIEEEYSDEVPSGRIIKTSPSDGEEVKPGSIVTLHKSIGPEIKRTKVPDLTGKTRVEAQKILADAKLTVGKVDPEEGKNFIDKIVKQQPAAGTEVDQNSAVDLFLDVPPEPDNKTVNITIPLNDAQKYGNEIKVLVKITMSDSDETETLMDEPKNKKDFPLNLSIPVSKEGSTKVKVYLDDKKVFDNSVK